jgi:hypothetical protein
MDVLLMLSLAATLVASRRHAWPPLLDSSLHVSVSCSGIVLSCLDLTIDFHCLQLPDTFPFDSFEVLASHPFHLLSLTDLACNH